MQLWSVAHFHPHFWVGATANPPKNEDGNGQLKISRSQPQNSTSIVIRPQQPRKATVRI
jgi:hypothetical protein